MTRTALLVLSLLVLSACSSLVSTPETQQTSPSQQKIAQLSARDEEPKPEFPGEAAAYWAGLHDTPNGENPARLNLLARQEIEARRAAEGITPVPNFQFADFGPGVFGGRLRGLVVKSNDSDTLLVGSVSGGIWKSTDGGDSWVAQDEFLDSLAVGSMITDDDDADRVWVGTGEGFFNTDAAQGLGLFRSDDFGATWAQVAATDDDEDFYYVNRLARIPSTDILIAATRTGIHRSADLGATWAEVSGATVTGRGFTDLQVDPSDTTRLFATLFGAGDGFLVFATVNSPGGIAGDYLAPLAQFGPGLGAGVTGDVVAALDGTGTTTDACQAITNGGAVSGNIALVDRGSCAFTVKAQNAENAGATAVIVANNVSGTPFSMAGTDPGLTIPSVMVSMDDGALIRANLPANVTLAESTELASAIYRSENSGATWSVLDSNGIPTTDISRMEIGIGSDGVVYLSISDAANATRGLYRSINNGDTFAQTASATPFIERQGWYDLPIGVDPSDSDTVYMGAVDMFRTNNAGATITKKTFWNPGGGQVPNFVHADHHVITFDPGDSDTVYIGSDGGIFKSTDGGDTFEPLNNGLNVAQYYGIGVNAEGTRAIGGTQDNGTHFYFGDRDVWIEWAGGDGSFASWDQQDDNFMYGATPGAALYGSADGGLSTTTLPLPDTTGALFISPFTIDPNNGNRFIIGTDNVFFSSNVRSHGAVSWSDDSGSLGASINALTISPASGSVAYAGTVSGTIHRTTALGTGAAWTDITDPGMPSSDVTWIEEAAGGDLYVTFADYGSSRIWKSTDSGSSWTDISGDLPDMPVFSVREDPTDATRLFLGTELGLWITDDNSRGAEGIFEWIAYDYGMPLTRVMQLYFVGDDVLWAGTHGRGIFRAQRSPFEIELGEVDDSALGCDPDGILDQGEPGLLPVTVTNRGGQMVTSVSATVASLDGAVDVADGNLTFADLAPGASDTQLASIEGGATVACLTEASIQVDVTSDNGSGSAALDLLVAGDPVDMTGTLTEDAEDAATPFTDDTRIGSGGWARTGTQANTGTMSWFTDDEGNFCDKSLISPWLDVGGGTTELDFSLFYDTEGDGTQRWDGVVLELRTEGGDWFDIGDLSTVPYDGVLFTNNSAPGRMAWSGTQTTWRDATVDLGATVNGERAQFRYRMVCDLNTANVGFWIDDISITNVTWRDSVTCEANGCTLFVDGFESGDTSAW
ncbi:MAG: hypothetical protein GY719_16450 [bacterium]|nr:hypothetical protein [bacterium]